MITRHFLDLPARRVHFLRSGDGPPAVLIHSSPANVWLLEKEIERLCREFTVFAFDTPGFGLSDPLPGTVLEVSDLADALAETLEALGMPACPIFGTHTGAAIALEFGVRHPARATGLVLDGVPVFTDEECQRYFGDYFRSLPLDDLGSQYSATWTRFRDQSIWFPWSERVAAHFNPYDLGPPHSTHLWVSMYFEAADHYTPAYRAASYYGRKALVAASALTLPTVYTAIETDMLYPHLERLPALKPGQSIEAIGSSYERKRDLIADSFARYGAAGPAPLTTPVIGTSAGLSRQFVRGTAGNLHLRWAGQRNATPLLVLHDAPGSSEQIVPLIEELGKTHFAIAPDLPGCGESDRFATQPTVHDYVADLLALLDTLDLGSVHALGIGFGGSIAVELARRAPDRVDALALCGLALPDVAERTELVARIAPEIGIESDGAHWYRTWLMLRDWQVYWPWFDRRQHKLRRIDADFSARPLHRWTLDVMRARTSYHHLIHAALAHDAAAALQQVEPPLVLLQDRGRPLSAYDAALAASRPDAPVMAVADPADYAAALAARWLASSAA